MRICTDSIIIGEGQLQAVGNLPAEKRKNGHALEPQDFDCCGRNGCSFNSVALVIDLSYSDDVADSNGDTPELQKDGEVHESPLGWITATDVAQGFEEYTFTNYIKVIYPLIRDQNEKVPIIVYSMYNFA